MSAGMDNYHQFLLWLSYFVYLYPCIMALVWTCGGVYYYFHWERAQLKVAKQGPLQLPHYPKVSVMVPCYNEGANVNETIGQALRLDYPNFEVVAINDGSKDDTAERLDELALSEPRLVVVHQDNGGKASALNHGLEHTSGEFLLCIDGDALLDPQAARWMVQRFLHSRKLGAVTGNPRVRTRSTIIGKLQTGEFSSIIGLIKRAQRIYGTVFTVSGVIVAFRKQAIVDIGGLSTDMITEDIDVSWKLQMRNWLIHYEPLARCWVLMPETLRGLYKQRLRWAQGGAEVFLRYGLPALYRGQTHFWPLLFEYMISVLWSYSVVTTTALHLFDAYSIDENVKAMDLLTFEWSGLALIFVCLLQFSVSIMIDRNYDSNLFRNFLWCIWYPLVYWMLNVVTVVVAVPKAILRKRGQKAVWDSPDRGESFRDG